jgi:hypothetical protein
MIKKAFSPDPFRWRPRLVDATVLAETAKTGDRVRRRTFAATLARFGTFAAAAD